jgi:hypothetical protein
MFRELSFSQLNVFIHFFNKNSIFGSAPCRRMFLRRPSYLVHQKSLGSCQWTRVNAILQKRERNVTLDKQCCVIVGKIKGLTINPYGLVWRCSCELSALGYWRSFYFAIWEHNLINSYSGFFMKKNYFRYSQWIYYHTWILLPYASYDVLRRHNSGFWLATSWCECLLLCVSRSKCTRVSPWSDCLIDFNIVAFCHDPKGQFFGHISSVVDSGDIWAKLQFQCHPI